MKLSGYCYSSRPASLPFWCFHHSLLRFPNLISIISTSCSYVFHVTSTLRTFLVRTFLLPIPEIVFPSRRSPFLPCSAPRYVYTYTHVYLKSDRLVLYSCCAVGPWLSHGRELRTTTPLKTPHALLAHTHTISSIQLPPTTDRKVNTEEHFFNWTKT